MEFFESKVRPILVDNCYSCHSRTATKVRGKLLLDTKADLLKGGDTGPGIVPGDLEASLLIKAVRYTNDDLKMPPKNKKLRSEQIARLETWVKMGAPDPRTGTETAGLETIRDKAKKHWAFLPVVEPKIPTVRNEKAIQTPVDNFVLTQLESNKLHFSARADRRTLIRRAYFDLIGLPPTPGRSGGVRGGSFAGCLCQSGGSVAGFAALRGTVGAILAGCGALRGHTGICFRGRSPLRIRLYVSGLCNPVVQRGFALRRIFEGADCGGLAAGGDEQPTFAGGWDISRWDGDLSIIRTILLTIESMWFAEG